MEEVSQHYRVLMMLVVPDAANIVPDGRLVTAVALSNFDFAAASRDLCVLLAGDGLVKHVEVHHVVTWRRLMALGTSCRVGRRVLVSLDCPFIPYGELQKNYETMTRFGQGLKAVEAISERLTP